METHLRCDNEHLALGKSLPDTAPWSKPEWHVGEGLSVSSLLINGLVSPKETLRNELVRVFIVLGVLAHVSQGD